MSKLLKAGGAILAAGIAGVGWGLVEAQLFTVRRVTVPVLPEGSEDLRILHVSDFHLGQDQWKKIMFIRRLSGLHPDLIVNTGDNITSEPAIHTLNVSWGPLRKVPGVFVFGSNDFQAPQFKSPLRYVTAGRSEAVSDDDTALLPTDVLQRKLEGNGWKDLNNQRAVLEVAGLRIEFRGTGDAHQDRDDYAAVAGPASEGIDFSIGVTHAPYARILDAMTADGVDMIFAGHTHGGQVCVPGYGALTTNCDLPTSKVKGLSSHSAGGRTAQLHVSAGLGTSPYAPVRFWCRPEVTLLTLTSRA